METDYKVKLEIFEGPLDLLLYLIKQDEIDIYEISLERITSQYLEYLQAFKELNIDIAGEEPQPVAGGSFMRRPVARLLMSAVLRNPRTKKE